MSTPRRVMKLAHLFWQEYDALDRNRKAFKYCLKRAWGWERNMAR